MAKRITKSLEVVCGMDVSDQWTQLCVLDSDEGEVIEESRVRTTPEGIRRRFGGMDPMRIALEVGTHSPWMSEVLEELGKKYFPTDHAYRRQ